jgi:putative Mg2+ transporter-C (MgtC) family protein
MDHFWRELTADLPTASQMVTVTFRLTLAAIAGALPGLQRERVHVAAGLRTHMLVSLGAAIFVLAAIRRLPSSAKVATRVIQGLATGIGFVGAGAILKSSRSQQVHGLTTASSIWLAAALGTAAGLGRVWLTLLGSIFALVILATLRRFEQRIANTKPHSADSTT